MKNISNKLKKSTIIRNEDLKEIVEQKSYIHAKAHLALPVEDIEEIKDFYSFVFQVQSHKGKTPDEKLIYALEIGPIVIAFHQINLSLRNGINCLSKKEFSENTIEDTYFVPYQHFGFFHLSFEEYNGIVERLLQKKAHFLLKPTIINPNTDHQQLLAFACDPQGYVMEIRSSYSKRGFQANEFEQQSQENIKSQINV